MTQTYVVRLWLPDRPGALGAVASRIGAVRGDVVGIEILERGAGRAIDELVVELADDMPLSLLVAEMSEVEGVDVEDVRPVAEALHDPRLDALETAARLVGASTPAGLIEQLPIQAARTVGAHWAAVIDAEAGAVLSVMGGVPAAPWLVAFVEGSRSSGSGACDDIIWTPLAAAGLALVLGRDHTPYRARERRQAAALARIADTRCRELREREVRATHPATHPATGSAGPPVPYSVAQPRERSTARSHWV
ncbi:MAG: hypothetical protein ACRD0U_03115 [Acidimicrobiales bacterium]